VIVNTASGNAFNPAIVASETFAAVFVSTFLRMVFFETRSTILTTACFRCLPMMVSISQSPILFFSLTIK